MSERPDWVPAEIADEDLHWWLTTTESKLTELNYHWSQLGKPIVSEDLLYRCTVAAPYAMLLLVVMVILY